MSPNLSNNKKKITNINELKFKEVKKKLKEYFFQYYQILIVNICKKNKLEE